MIKQVDIFGNEIDIFDIPIKVKNNNKRTMKEQFRMFNGYKKRNVL